MQNERKNPENGRWIYMSQVLICFRILNSLFYCFSFTTPATSSSSSLLRSYLALFSNVPHTDSILLTSVNPPSFFNFNYVFILLLTDDTLPSTFFWSKSIGISFLTPNAFFFLFFPPLCGLQKEEASTIKWDKSWIGSQRHRDRDRKL